MKRRALLTFLAAAALVAAVPGVAWGPRIKLIPGASGPCTVDGTVGSFAGAVELLGFNVKQGLMADVSFTGTCWDGTTGIGSAEALRGHVPVTLSHVTCESATVTLGGSVGNAPATDGSKEPLMSFDLSEVEDVIVGNKRDRRTTCALANAKDPYLQARLLNLYIRS